MVGTQEVFNPQKRQHFADHHAAIFAQQNPRFDHARFHQACGTTHVRKEANIPSLPIQEGLHDNSRLGRYLDAMNLEFTASGSVAQSSNAPQAVNDLKHAMLLQERRKKKFGEDDNRNNELDSIRAQNKRK
jgi:hypothetical protein